MVYNGKTNSKIDTDCGKKDDSQSNCLIIKRNVWYVLVRKVVKYTHIVARKTTVKASLT